jgi:hypothetical protein
MLRWRVIGYLPHLPLLLLPYLIRIHPGLAGLGLRGAAVYVRLLRHRHGRTPKPSSRGSHASKTALARARAAKRSPGWRARSKGAASKTSLRLLLLRLAVRVLRRGSQAPETTNLRLLLLRGSSEHSLGLLRRSSEWGTRAGLLLLPHHAGLSHHSRLLSRHPGLLSHGLLGHSAQHGVIDDPRRTRRRHPPLTRAVQHLPQLLHGEVEDCPYVVLLALDELMSLGKDLVWVDAPGRRRARDPAELLEARVAAQEARLVALAVAGERPHLRAIGHEIFPERILRILGVDGAPAAPASAAPASSSAAAEALVIIIIVAASAALVSPASSASPESAALIPVAAPVVV